MNKKIIFTIFLCVILFVKFYFIDKPYDIPVKQKSKISYTDDMVIPQINKIQNADYVYQLIPPPADTIPYLSTFMDYATNGNALKQLILHGDTIVTTVTYVDSLGAADPNNSVNLSLAYNLSTNGGITWEFNSRYPLGDSKSRFGDAGLIDAFSGLTFMISGRFWNTPMNSTVRRAGSAWDIVLGAGTFTTDRLQGTLGTDLFSSVRIDNKAACIVKTPSFTAGGTDTIYYTTYTPSVFPYYSTLKPIKITSMTNNASSYIIAASPIDANHITAVYCLINEPNENLVPVTRVQTSTNGGNNWSTPFEIAPTAIINGDSSACYWHEDVAYKPGTNNAYVVFSTDIYSTGSGPDEYRKAFKICLWNQTLNGGNPVVIADWHNVPILSDNSLFYRIRKYHANSRAINNPSLGFKSDGSRMFVAYSVCQVDTSALGFTYEDVFYQYSDNGGVNWSTPVNLTNTPNQVEKYPVVPKTFPGNLPPVMYQWDQVPGSQSFTDLAPVNRVYWILRKDILTHVDPITNGIPQKFSLHQNYPNPFNPQTKIKFEIPKDNNSVTLLKVYDILGREVRTLVNENLKPGVYEAALNATDLPSGVYFYKLTAGNFADTKKMILLK